MSESNYDLPETQLNKSVGVGGENFATNTVGKISPWLELDNFERTCLRWHLSDFLFLFSYSFFWNCHFLYPLPFYPRLRPITKEPISIFTAQHIHDKCISNSIVDRKFWKILWNCKGYKTSKRLWPHDSQSRHVDIINWYYNTSCHYRETFLLT